jgi:hypothetical protein
MTNAHRIVRPAVLSTRELSDAGVELLDPASVTLRCEHCGRQWIPNRLSGGDLPPDYWRCPNGCNRNVARP